MTASGDSTTTLADLLVQRAADTPRAIAFQHRVEGGRWEPVSWQDFARSVQTLRRGLAAAKLQRGDRLAVIAPVSLEWEVLHHAALSMGVVVVGMDAHDLPARIANMAEQAGIAAFVVIDAAVLQQVTNARLSSARFVLQLGPGTAPLPPGTRELSWVQLAALGARDSSVAEPAPPEADDMATIIFTSGTTGAPKGIPYNHGQVCLAVNAICDAFAFVDSNSRLLCWLPLSNLLQRVVNLAAVRQGAATYLLGDPRQVMQVVAQVSPDVFIGVPRFYEKLYDGLRANIEAQTPVRRWLAATSWSLGRRLSRHKLRQQEPPLALRLAHAAAEHLVLRRIRGIMGQRLRVMVTGSAPIPRHLLEEFHALGWLVLEAYGLSENVVPMAMNRIDAFRFGTVGRPLPANEIVVADGGSIKVRGPGLFRGYLEQDGSGPTSADGFYVTGDLGHFDDDGYLSLTGRSSELIKTSTGRRVAPVAVEAQLSNVLGIDQAILIGSGRKFLVALCTSAPLHLGSRAHARLESALRRQAALISDHDRPKAIVLIERPFSIDSGELTPNLKLKRQKIEVRHAALIENLYRWMDQHPTFALRDDLAVFTESDLTATHDDSYHRQSDFRTR